MLGPRSTHFLGREGILLTTELCVLQTFVVVSRGKDIFRFNATDAMWLLDPFNPIRRVAICILVHPLFSLFIITTILTNCILMIMPTTPTVESTE
jgi:voltage-gated sodium channel type II alpha